jgi:two-component system, NarL family, response regulator DesR
MTVIRVALGHHGALLRGALAAMLSQEADLDVRAEIGAAAEVLPMLARTDPQVLVLDSHLAGEVGIAELCHQIPGPGVLVLIDPSEVTAASLTLVRLAPRVGFIATDASPSELVEAVRNLAGGAPVLDPVVTVAALRAVDNPLTGRELEVLRLLATGATAGEIARRLGLTAGTVRNYLSHILTKTNARNRIDAVRKAQEAGWI